MTLAVATAADVADVVALVESAFRGESSRAGWTTEADLLDGRRTGPDEIAELLANPAQALLLERSTDGTLAASVTLRRAGEVAWLGMLSVKPTLQGGGRGRRVLEAAERWAQAHWGVATICMTVIVQRTELIAWYERRGYRLTGETAPFYYGDARFGLPKREDLSFVVMEKALR